LGHRIVAIVLFVASVVWFILSLRLPFPVFARVSGMSPGHYPAVLSVAMAILAVLLFVQTFRQDGDEEGDLWDAEEEEPTGDARPFYIGAALLLGYIVFLPFLGFLISSVVFVFLFTLIIGKYSFPLITALAAGIPGLLWIIFARLLTVPLPKGPWGF